ncbi:hypothetical protein CR203_03705 [Salipaludibacillus neizhouensis]|uniref:Swt1-like HEPN domain-containing protein n=1 Tax=Salipaludibacillus neizhouensis TaxID=885475 RepID=A0A3A9K9H0_9BACI|nr:hypothetical protein [Salipaludibacillus neizhouensis]RKL69147.1 hypothetical protein CR203_03705 [Salipaludibacillus neizhouensis]
MHELDVDYMTSAYRMLYEIETQLKYHVHSTLFRKHGWRWEEYLKFKKPLDDMLFREVLNLYEKHPLFRNYFEYDELTFLLSSKPIRNDIAHMKVISSDEYNLLLKFCHVVKVKLNAQKQNLRFFPKRNILCHHH